MCVAMCKVLINKKRKSHETKKIKSRDKRCFMLGVFFVTAELNKSENILWRTEIIYLLSHSY